MTDALPIYRQVNGKLVPIEKRDPKQRYASTSGPNGTFLREFTDEEERERDAEEARWEAERPQREAEAKRREEEAEQFKRSLKYEYRLVSFLDVLGWSAAIDRSIEDAELTINLGQALAALRAQVQMNEWRQELPGGWRGDPQITQLSDTIILSFSLEKKTEHWNKSALESALFWITGALLNAGLFIRGAVVPGLLVHKRTIVYGPALVDAHTLGDQRGNPPRVVLHHTLSAWGLDTPVSDREGNLIGSFKSRWRQDRDGSYFFDFLQDQFPSHEKRVQPSTHHLHTLNKARGLIASNFNAFRGQPEETKYRWLANYFNEVCKESNVTSLDLISIQ